MITKKEIIEVLKTCHDPEIPVDLWNLGLIYNIDIVNDTINILMTLTTPGCTMIDVIANDMKDKILSMKGVNIVNVKTTFEPPWTPEMMSDIAKEKLGFKVKKNEPESNWE